MGLSDRLRNENMKNNEYVLHFCPSTEFDLNPLIHKKSINSPNTTNYHTTETADSSNYGLFRKETNQNTELSNINQRSEISQQITSLKSNDMQINKIVPIFNNSNKISQNQNVEFVPNIFQKLTFLEDEIITLKKLNEVKEAKIRFLEQKLEVNPDQVYIQLSLVKKELEYYKAENKELKKHSKKKDRKGSQNGNPNFDKDEISEQLKSLENEKFMLIEKYENYKRIVNNSTYEDIEILTNRIAGMESQLKELKRTNERLKAQGF